MPAKQRYGEEKQQSGEEKQRYGEDNQNYGDSKQQSDEENKKVGGDNNTGNEYSLCFKFSYKDLSVLYTGDIGSETEQSIVEKYSNDSDFDDTFNSDFYNVLTSTILKVPHHGSKYSSSEGFLKAVNPSCAVISVGCNNLYGHPAPETLVRLEEHGIKAFRTDHEGAVMISLREWK